jgi:hypothetical protein
MPGDKSVRKLILASALFFLIQPAVADKYIDLIDEEYLRIQFTIDDGEKLKYKKCEEKTYPTCTYIWGKESKKDASRLKHGLAPKGDKLQLIYAQASSEKDFQHVAASYKDAEKIDGLGVEAVWSAARKQLSMITDTNLIVHINIEQAGSGTPKDQFVSIANNLLKKL